jgi:hypothetical protein
MSIWIDTPMPRPRCPPGWRIAHFLGRFRFPIGRENGNGCSLDERMSMSLDSTARTAPSPRRARDHAGDGARKFGASSFKIGASSFKIERTSVRVRLLDALRGPRPPAGGDRRGDRHSRHLA